VVKILFYRKMDSLIGRITLIADETNLKRILFEDEEDAMLKEAEMSEDSEILIQAFDELSEYFNGNLKEFKVSTDPDGTEFQKRCWNVLKTIEYGKTISYEEQAICLGDKNKMRAVGNANGKNPVPIIIPCHRVIGKSGKLVGYGGGIHIKEFLLNLEGKHNE